MNRLTITLDDDLYAMARAHAISTKTSLSKAIGSLLRQRASEVQPLAEPETEASSYFDPVLGIQVSRCVKPITMENIQRAIDDEDVRYMEIMGLSPEEIERALAQ